MVQLVRPAVTLRVRRGAVSVQHAEGRVLRVHRVREACALSRPRVVTGHSMVARHCMAVVLHIQAVPSRSRRCVRGDSVRVDGSHSVRETGAAVCGETGAAVCRETGAAMCGETSCSVQGDGE